jgi:threonine dehydratase
MNPQVLPPSPAQREAARRVVAQHLQPTPTVALSVRGRTVWAKLEMLQPTGSFKIRGALSAMDAASQDGVAVITSSAGNHGLGIAHAAMILGVRATVVVPTNASAVKVARLRRYDIELLQIGTSYDDAQEEAMRLAEERSIRFVSPFNNTHVLAGQATIFDELAIQVPDLEHLVVSVGGGGLLSGILLSRDEHHRGDLRVTGVQPENSAALYQTLYGDEGDAYVHRPTIADGLAGGGDEGSVTNDIVADHKIPLVLVPETDIRRAVRECVETNGLVIEGSASASYAAIAEDLVGDPTSTIGFIATGRNISLEILVQILQEPLA